MSYDDVILSIQCQHWPEQKRLKCDRNVIEQYGERGEQNIGTSIGDGPPTMMHL